MKNWEKDFAHDLTKGIVGTVITSRLHIQLFMPGPESWKGISKIMKYHDDKFAIDDTLFCFFARNWLQGRGYKAELRIAPSISVFKYPLALIMYKVYELAWNLDGLELFKHLKRNSNNKNN